MLFFLARNLWNFAAKSFKHFCSGSQCIFSLRLHTNFAPALCRRSIPGMADFAGYWGCRWLGGLQPSQWGSCHCCDTKGTCFNFQPVLLQYWILGRCLQIQLSTDFLVCKTNKLLFLKFKRGLLNYNSKIVPTIDGLHLVVSWQAFPSRHVGYQHKASQGMQAPFRPSLPLFLEPKCWVIIMQLYHFPFHTRDCKFCFQYSMHRQLHLVNHAFCCPLGFV